MPTGYTARLCEGPQRFEDFVKTCARGFGALVSMRDQTMSAPFPERIEPSGYYTEQIAKASAELDRLTSLSLGDAIYEASVVYQQQLDRHIVHVKKVSEMRIRLVAMLDKVKSWTPPSADHVGLKEFMVEQLETTMNHDGEPYLDEPVLLSGADYLEHEITRQRKIIQSNKEGDAEERKRAQERTDWIQQLLKSLGGYGE